eukprot:587935-Rhodomonas_salina.1
MNPDPSTYRKLGWSWAATRLTDSRLRTTSPTIPGPASYRFSTEHNRQIACKAKSSTRTLV